MVDNFEEMSLTPEEVRKHPLENAWTLWFFKVILMLVTLDEQCMVSLNYSLFQNDKSRTWEENQRPIITVTTVEDFWSLYNHIETPSKLPFGSDYSLFKVLESLDKKFITILSQEGIFPDWEDPRNASGGRWMVGVDR